MENTIQSDLIRGHINTIILKALFDGDRYGYDIVREIEQKSSGQYKLKQPTLYSCLKRLEIQGFIRSYWGAKSNGGRRKYFTLTDMGRELFIKNQSEWEYSRTVIDKLISDREVNLSDYAPLPDDVNMVEEESRSEYIEETDEEVFEEETSSEKENTQETTEETSATYDDESEQSQDETAESTEESVSSAPVFSDTTAIMDELFRRHDDEKSDESYADKLVSEKYVSDRTASPLSTDTYFKDFFDEYEENKELPEEQESVEEAVSESEPAEQEEQAMPQTSMSPFLPPEQDDYAERKSSETFLDYHTSTVTPQPENAIIEREYKNILGDFLNQSFVANSVTEPHEQGNNIVHEEASAESEDSAVNDNEATDYVAEDELDGYSEDLETYTDDAAVNRKLNNIADEVREMGSNVVIRTHNNESSKEYANTYYYYSNKLMILHYGILFAIMMVEILFTAVFVNLVLHAGRSFDKWLYIIAAVVAVAFPLIAFIKNFYEPNKRKRINFHLKNSLVYRLIVMAQCLLIVYCVNVIAKMPLGFSIDYITSLLLPALLCIDFPISALVFNVLFKSKKFAVEQ